MSRVIVAMTVAVAMMGASSMARADAPGGDACAAKLTPEGKAIYAAVAAANPTSQTLRDVVEKQTRGLAMNGKIARGKARENATAAGECMKARLN